MHRHDGAKYRHTGIQRDTVNIILIRVDPHLPGTVPFTGVGCRPAPRAGSLDARIFCKTKVLQAIHVTFFIDKKVTKKSSRAKNSLIHLCFCLVFWFACSPVLISRSVSFP